MQVKRTPKGFLIRLDQGEELYESLDIFAAEHQIQSGTITGIGMVRFVELGYFDTELANYDRSNYEENMEVLSFSGTITEYDDKPFFHIHGIFGRKDFSTVGGYVMKAVADMTVEIFVSDFETRVTRALDENTGLKLLNI